jgi:hypothetical protein
VLLTVIVGAFPLHYYLDELMQARGRMEAQGMTLVPDVIERLLRAAEKSLRSSGDLFLLNFEDKR